MNDQPDNKQIWADYFARILEVSGHAEASIFLKKVHGSGIDISAQIDEKLKDVEIIRSN